MTQATYQEIDGRPAIRFERRIAHPVEAVWHAVTEPGELAHWFPDPVELDELKPGASMRFDLSAHGMDPMDGEIRELEPPRLFAFTWGDEMLRFELDPEDGGRACRLRFTHFLSERDKAARDAAGWQVCFDRLDESLAAGGAGAANTGVTPAWREYYERYLAEGMPSGAEIPGQA
ncbi:MAG TPA: SRPBCC family protein [Thermoleophilaceae bacterium]